MERTLLFIKPDAVKEGKTGKIISMVEENGFCIRDIKMVWLSSEEAGDFYKIHKGKFFYDELVKYITSGPIIVLLLEKKDAVKSLRKLVGATDPSKAETGTIRRLYGKDVQKNAVHASDFPSNAKREIEFFFGGRDG